MSKKIKKFTEAQACKALDIDIMQLKFLLQAADRVMQEIAPDVCSLYKKGVVPRYDMIEMVCDCSRITQQMVQMQRLPSDESRRLLDDVITKFKAASMEVKYGVVGIELSSRVFVM
jgi:predicted rRNA methylase YqxC with S4 and FtsJ domains